jgi:hypothetical protein
VNEAAEGHKKHSEQDIPVHYAAGINKDAVQFYEK